TPVAPARLVRERAAAGNAVDDAVGDEILEGAPHRLPAHAVFLGEFGLRGQPRAVAVPPRLDGLPELARELRVGRFRFPHLVVHDGPILAAGRHSPPRATSWLAMTLRWISLVPSPTIISGASRK